MPAFGILSSRFLVRQIEQSLKRKLVKHSKLVLFVFLPDRIPQPPKPLISRCQILGLARLLRRQLVPNLTRRTS